STVAVSPAVGGPVPFDTNVHYDVTVSDNDVGSCPGANYDIFTGGTDPGITATFDGTQFASAQPGGSVTFGMEVNGSEDADPGTHTVPLEVANFGSSFEFLPAQLTFVLAQPTGCFVSSKRELMILDTSVVDDAVRAPSPGGSGVPE